jgi:hypothetical protein
VVKLPLNPVLIAADYAGYGMSHGANRILKVAKVMVK